MTKREYEKRREIIREKNRQMKYRKELREERLKGLRTLFPKLETSKLFAAYLFILLNAIVIYAMAAMWVYADLSYLGVLISDIAAQVLVYGIYCMKAYKAKKSEEEMRYKRDRFLGAEEQAVETGEDCNDPVG